MGFYEFCKKLCHCEVHTVKFFTSTSLKLPASSIIARRCGLKCFCLLLLAQARQLPGAPSAAAFLCQNAVYVLAAICRGIGQDDTATMAHPLLSDEATKWQVN